MKKILFYSMVGEKMCFLHVLMNALQLKEGQHDVKIIFEGASVQLPGQLEEEKNALYLKAKEQGLIAGICEGCSKMMGVYEANLATGLPMLADMNGHAGMRPFVEEGYAVISI